MKTFKYISIVFLLFGFSFALVQCAKEDKDASTNNNEIDQIFDESKIKELLTSSGFKIENENSNIEYRGIQSCGPHSTTTTTCFSYPASGVINVPANGNNPGCIGVYATFTIDVCLDNFTNNLVSLAISDLNVSDCGELKLYWGTLNYNEVAMSEEAYFFQASLVIEETIVSIMIGNGQTCPNSYVQFYYSENKCYQLCMEVLHEYPFINLTRSYCGYICCLRTTKWCRDSSGILNHSVPVFEQIEGFGECGEHPIGKCEGIPISTCEHECGPSSF